MSYVQTSHPHHLNAPTQFAAPPTMVALPTSPVPVTLVPHSLPTQPLPPSALTGLQISSGLAGTTITTTTVPPNATGTTSGKGKGKKKKTYPKRDASTSTSNGRVLPPCRLSEEDLALLNNFEVANQCSECDYYCDKKDRMRRHIRTVHLKAKPFSCDLCPYSAARKDKLKRHYDTVHSDEKPFKCDFCNHVSNRKDKIKVHVETVHLKTRPPQKSHKKKKQQQQQQQQQVQTVATTVATSVASAGPPKAVPYGHLIAQDDHFMVVNL